MRKRSLHIIGGFVFALAVTLLAAGLQSAKADTPSIKLVHTSLIAEQGKQYTLQTDSTSSSGLVWESSDPAVATVTDGIVTAKKPGYAKISVAAASAPSQKTECMIVVRPEQVMQTACTEQGKKKLVITWKGLKDCDGYQLYYRKKGAQQYSVINASKKTKADITGLSPETGYDILVAAYVDTPIGRIEGPSSTQIRTYTAPNKPSSTKITKISKGKYSFYRGKKIRFFTVKWKKVKGANAYRVYCKNGKKKPQLVDTVKKPKASLYAALGYKYKIYVVPCRTLHGITTAGKKSSAVTVDMRW